MRFVDRIKVPEEVITKAKRQRAARISARQLAVVADLVARVAEGGDATVQVDAQSLLPMLTTAIKAAPPGQPRARATYRVTQPSGTVVLAAGLVEAAKAARKAKSTLANAMTIGGGRATFPTQDEHGNPAVVTVEKLA